MNTVKDKSFASTQVLILDGTIIGSDCKLRIITGGLTPKRNQGKRLNCDQLFSSMVHIKGNGKFVKTMLL